MGLRKKHNRASGEVPELGAIFMCNRATKKMCFTWKTFGLPFCKEGFVRQVKAGMFLFLFEYETRKLYGVYQAWSDGEMNLSSEAFSSTGKKYPAQVHFKVLWYCEPLSEDEFRPAIKHNYFAPYKFNFGLTKNQVMKLLWLFNSRKLRDELLLERMLPSYPFSRGTIREEFPFRAENEYVPENSNDLELNKNVENLFMPNREVHGRLLIDGDIDVGHECADAVQLSSNYRRELSHRNRVIQVRDNTDYGYNWNSDYDLNSGVPFLSTDEKYDPDIPLFEGMPAPQQPQRYDEENGPIFGGVDAGNSVDGRLEDDEVSNFTRYFQPTISNSMATHPAYFDNTATEGPGSYNPDLGTSLQGCERYSKVHLNPDFFRGLNNSINIEPLKPPSENILLLPSETDNASILRQAVAYYDPSQTINYPITTDGHFQSGLGIESFDPDHYEEGALQHSSADGRTHDWETIVPSFCVKDISNPVDVNEDSKVCKEREPVSQNKKSVFSRLKPAAYAGDESKLKDSQKSIDDMVNEVMYALKGHYCQLTRGISSTTKQVDDDDNTSKITKHQSSPSQAAKCKSVAPLEMGFDLSSANEGCETQSDSQIIGEMPRLNFKRRSEVQKIRNLAEGGLAEASSTILVDKQSKRRKLVRPTFNDKKLSNADAVLDNISVKFTLSGQSFQEGSFNTDVPLPCDNAQNSSEAGNLGSGLLLAASTDIDVGSDYEKREKDERVETSTKTDLGGSLNDSDFCVVAGVDDHKLQLASVAKAADNRSGKSFGLDGSPQESPNDLGTHTKCFIPVKNEDTEDRIMRQDRVHEESNNTLLAEGTSAIVQATQVQYFEFF